MAKEKDKEKKPQTEEEATPELPLAEAAAPPWQGGLPLFYKNPQVLSAERHKKAGIKEGVDFGFARESNSVPLGANELFAAQFDFPVVFTEDNPALPVAVLGVGGSRNTFIDRAGTWRAN